MTMDQILEEYKKQFIIVIETVGEIQKNTSYKKVESILKKHLNNNEEFLIDHGAPFGVFVVLYISFLLAEIHGPEVVASWDDVADREECRVIYDNYLKEVTDNFTRKYGLEKVDLNKIKFVFKVIDNE